jgi:aminopeptidase
MAGRVDPDELRAYADVVLRCGVNLEEGQKLLIFGRLEHRELVKALAGRAYVHGAAVAQAYYTDEDVQRAQAAGAATDELAAYVSPWFERLIDTMIDERWAWISVDGASRDDPFAGAPAERVGALLGALGAQHQRTIPAKLSWCICPCPSRGWAQRVYGEPDIARLWKDLRFVLRLDEPDPVEAWHARRDELAARAAWLNERGFRALHFVGGGTDLRIPLHADGSWQSAEFITATGRSCIVNLPTEEVFVSPDWRGVEGIVVMTQPVGVNGVLVEDLVLTFAAGEVVDARASANVAAVKAQMDQDAGARRLGEVALVDESSRVGRLGRVFKDLLLDENATCHLAWGFGFEETIAGDLPDDEAARSARGLNTSRIHQDAMVGGPQVTVFGVDAAGDEAPILADERWQS